MKAIHNFLMFLQWFAFILGVLGAGPLVWFVGIPEGLLALVVAFLALANLKLEVLSFAR